MDAKRQPNGLLAAVMESAGLSNKGLAARVRAKAQTVGHSISPDHVSVRRWLDGVRPQVETARCIAAALADKLGRPVTLADIGFELATGPAEVDVVDNGAAYPESVNQSVDALDLLTTADMADSPTLAAAGWVSTATPTVITGYLFTGPMHAAALTFDGSASAVASRILATTRHLLDLDFRFGGGLTRKMLLSYWKSEIVPALRGNYPDAARREIFSAAADAAEALGWSAYDAGYHGAAQRYFVQGLRLAREANDPLMGGQILSSLSHQANYLGRFSDAVQYARAAQAATVGTTSATVQTMFLAMEARALASSGEAHSCVEVLRRAEAMFERRDPGNDPDWISYFDTLELAGEMAHCFRDLGQAAETQAFALQAVDPVLTPARTRAFIGMVNATGALAAGNLDEAVDLATQAVSLADSLQSSRYLKYVADFQLSLAAHVDHPIVKDFAEMVTGLHPSLIQPVST